MLKYNEIHIDGIGGIDSLKLKFNDSFNLICGPNGVGKTTILECLSQAFSRFPSENVRRKSNFDSGTWKITMCVEDKPFIIDLSTEYFHPSQQPGQGMRRSYSLNREGLGDHIINFKTNRTFQHVKIPAISSDQKDQLDQEYIRRGVIYGNTKNWFVHRHMWSKHTDALSEIQLQNFEIAKTLFSVLDASVKFRTVRADTHDIILTGTDGSDIYFEYLSSGFKSALYILFALMKEIEFRFKDPSVLVTNFNGVLIIDELDLHLHPKWQASIIRSLRSLLPNAQIIVTSHSPHMLQAVSANEVIPLGFDESGKVTLRSVETNEYGFQGWTVEEILTDVMGLEDVRSELYLNTLRDFEIALDEDNKEEAVRAFEILDKMLHPRNHLRKILKIQMASLGE